MRVPQDSDALYIIVMGRSSVDVSNEVDVRSTMLIRHCLWLTQIKQNSQGTGSLQRRDTQDLLHQESDASTILKWISLRLEQAQIGTF